MPFGILKYGGAALFKIGNYQKMYSIIDSVERDNWATGDKGVQQSYFMIA